MRAGSTHRNEIQPTLCSWSPDRGFLMLLATASGLSFRTSVVKTQLSVVARSTLHAPRRDAVGEVQICTFASQLFGLGVPGFGGFDFVVEVADEVLVALVRDLDLPFVAVAGYADVL